MKSRYEIMYSQLHSIKVADGKFIFSLIWPLSKQNSAENISHIPHMCAKCGNMQHRTSLASMDRSTEIHDGKEVLPE